MTRKEDVDAGKEEEYIASQCCLQITDFSSIRRAFGSTEAKDRLSKTYSSPHGELENVLGKSFCRPVYLT